MVTVTYTAADAKHDTDIVNHYTTAPFCEDELFMQQVIDKVEEDIKGRIKYGYYYTTVMIPITPDSIKLREKEIKNLWKVIDLFRTSGYSFSRVVEDSDRFTMEINWAE